MEIANVIQARSAKMVCVIVCLFLAANVVSLAQETPVPDAPVPDTTSPNTIPSSGTDAAPEKLRTQNSFIVVLTGDPFAVPHNATDVLADFGVRQGGLVLGKGKRYDGEISNDPVAACKIIEDSKPAFGLVTPGFYFKHKAALHMDAKFEAARHSYSTEQFRLFTAEKNVTLEALAGKTIATSLALESDWLEKVVLGKRCVPVWKQSGELASALIQMSRGDKDAPSAVLCNRALCADVDATPNLRSALHAVYTSPELNHPFFVAFTNNLNPGEGALLETHVYLMNDDDAGQKILQHLGIDAWIELNTHLMESAEKALSSEERKEEHEVETPVPSEK